MGIQEIELYKEKILELTNLLRTEWFDKRVVEDSGLDVEKIF
jgi:hypothetical protein